MREAEMMGENKFPYQDQDLDIESRIDDLLCRMTSRKKWPSWVRVVLESCWKMGSFLRKG